MMKVKSRAMDSNSGWDVHLLAYSVSVWPLVKPGSVPRSEIQDGKVTAKASHT